MVKFVNFRLVKSMRFLFSDEVGKKLNLSVFFYMGNF